MFWVDFRRERRQFAAISSHRSTTGTETLKCSITKTTTSSRCNKRTTFHGDNQACKSTRFLAWAIVRRPAERALPEESLALTYQPHEIFNKNEISDEEIKYSSSPQRVTSFAAMIINFHKNRRNIQCDLISCLIYLATTMSPCWPKNQLCSGLLNYPHGICFCSI